MSRTTSDVKNQERKEERRENGKFGEWLGGAVRAMTEANNTGYVVLGDTKYGLRLSRDNHLSSIKAKPSQETKKKRKSKEDEYQEWMSEKSGCSDRSTSDLVGSVTDCCCIGPRSRLPVPRFSLSSTLTENVSSSSTVAIASIPVSTALQPPTKAHPSSETAAQLPPNSNSNNNRGWLQTSDGASASITIGKDPQSSCVLLTTSNVSRRSSFGVVATTLTSTPSSTVTTVPSRHYPQWNKPQEAIITVDRLHKFRWSGGGGGSGKKSSSGTRSEKADRLRELTEKLKGPTPVPPPRRPSRTQNSLSPPIIGSQPPEKSLKQESSTTADNSTTDSNVSTSTQRNLLGEGSVSTFSNRPSVSDDVESTSYHCQDETVSTNIAPETSTTSTIPVLSKKNLKLNRLNADRNSDDVSKNKNHKRDVKHYRQYSDSLVDNICKRADDVCMPSLQLPGTSKEDDNASNSETNEQSQNLITASHRSVPFRSASFGQADLNPEFRQKPEPIRDSCIPDCKETKASTLPRRRVNVNTCTSVVADDPIQGSPRASTPSLDSAVGSAEALGLSAGNVGVKDIRPLSDGSDSLATSSAFTSPEPVTEINDPKSDTVSSQMCNELILPPTTEVIADNVTNIPSHKEIQIEPHTVIVTPPIEESRLSQVSEISESANDAQSNTTTSGKLRRSRGDHSKRRKGVYITQWPDTLEIDRNKLLTQSSEERDDLPATSSDLSDCEGQIPKRYSKKPLRGPYGQMLEAEMAKPRITDVGNLNDDLRSRRKISANLSYNDSSRSQSELPTPCHQRTTSSPSKLEGLAGPSPELLAELLRGSSERVACNLAYRNDTRTHVVVELYDTERSYVEALQILVNKYFQSLKSPENSGLIDSATVDEIFYQIPSILGHHEVFLVELRKRLETWELRQTIGDVFLNVFTKPDVLETYTLFLNNWKCAKKTIKTACQTKPAFARFLEIMEREHKGKLGLDQLLIKPVQKIPRYELLIQRLLKHTETSHPDYDLLSAALKEVHELVVKINCTERESLEWEQQQSALREVQAVVEGLAGIVTHNRAFIRHDLVTIISNQGNRKERALFLFSDLLVITSIKRRSGTIKKPTTSCPNSLSSLLETNKYKMLMRISLDDLEVVKSKDENLRRMAQEVDQLREDCNILSQMQDLAASLHGPMQQIEDIIKENLVQAQRQLAERNAAHSQLACLELTLNTQSGMENITVMFSKPDRRASWEETFKEIKQKLEHRPSPEFIGPLPIRKTRAGLQFTCAAPVLPISPDSTRDVWVCNSDGYVGQVCVLSLSPEPAQVTSCNGVCNSRILCIAAIPASTSTIITRDSTCSGLLNNKTSLSISSQDIPTITRNIELDSISSSDESDSDDNIPFTETSNFPLDDSSMSTINNGTSKEDDVNQPTMWLGTEDGCIHVYNCSDNIRIKKNKIKIQHGSSVHCIIYVDNKVFVSLANGDVTTYCRDKCGWNSTDSKTVTVGSVATPVTKMLPVCGKLWCGCHNNIKVINPNTLDIEHSFIVNNDTNRWISCMAGSGSLGVWISLHNSAILRLFHATSYDCLIDVNIAPSVTKILSGCDDIIRQHKAACLRVTALLSCNELLWIGTSAGVLLTLQVPQIKQTTDRILQSPTIIGIPHGHTGRVRFLTCVEANEILKEDEMRTKINHYALKTTNVQQNVSRGRLLVISGGDGYEDFRGPHGSTELQAGREDSTNHLLLWKV